MGKQLSITHSSGKWTAAKYPLLIGCFISFVFAFYAATTLMSERTPDWKLYNIYNHYYPKPSASPNIVIIDIDDYSLANIGQWPWPRYHLGNILNLIADGRPAVIMLDILLSEADRTSLNNIKERFLVEFGIDLTYGNLPQGLDDNDAYLAETMNGIPVVLAKVLTQNKVANSGICEQRHIGSTQEFSSIVPVENFGALCPLDQFVQKSAATGFINAAIDRDGLLRHVPTVMEINDKIHPSLAVSGLTTLLGAQKVTLERNAITDYLQIADYQIPINSKGFSLLNFRGRGRSYNTIPILNIMNGSIEPSAFTGKIVFIGSSASALNDVVKTDLDPVFPGTEVHASFIDNVLNGDIITIPYWFEIAEAFAIFVVGLAIAFFVTRTKPLTYFVSSLLMVLTVIALTAFFLYCFQIYLSPYLVLINLAAVFSVVTLSKYYSSEKHLEKILAEISKSNQSIIESMATVAEVRDPETGGHIIRTRQYVKALASHLRNKEKYKKAINDEYIEYLYAAAPLHDIGKVGISDLILLKPGKLTDEEFETIKTHTVVGGQIIGQAEDRVGNSPYMQIAYEIATCHHEKWNGYGYPKGLSGPQIPLSARIMAIADVFDALCNKRAYKAAMSYEETISIINEDSGSHFDPDIVEAFNEISQEFIDIAKKINN